MKTHVLDGEQAMKPRLAIIGGGIAGISCAARAAADFDVTVLEAELQPGYHSSGRSAAVAIESCMNPLVHTLTRQSRQPGVVA